MAIQVTVVSFELVVTNGSFVAHLLVPNQSKNQSTSVPVQMAKMVHRLPQAAVPT
jgi:hypothetical protein